MTDQPMLDLDTLVPLGHRARLAVPQFEVLGEPVPQGSTRAFAYQAGGNGKWRAKTTSDNPKTKTWRADVAHAAVEMMSAHGWVKLDGPVAVEGHHGTGRNAGVLKDSAPAYLAVKPDLHKLLRSILDALGRGAACFFTEDRRVVQDSGTKVYAEVTCLPARRSP